MMVDYKKLDLPEENRYIMPASVMKRLLAFLIDFFIINFFIASPFMGIIENILPGNNTMSYRWLMSNTGATATLYFAMFFITMLSLLYFTLLDYKLGQTIGKMVMGIFVIKAPEKKPVSGKIKKNHGLESINILNAFVRNLFIIPFFPFILLWIIEPVHLMINKNGQRLMEKLSNTMTVELMGLSGR